MSLLKKQAHFFNNWSKNICLVKQKADKQSELISKPW